MSTTAIVATAIGAFVVLVVTLVVTRAQRDIGLLWQRLKARVRADHRTISTRQWAHGNATGARLHLAVACAPARALRGDRRVAPDRVASYVEETFPDCFPVEADYSVPAECVRYREPFAESPSEASTVVVWARGLIEWSLIVPHTSDATGAPIIELAELGGTLARIMRASTRAFPALFSSSRRARLDWYVGFAGSINTEQGWKPLAGFAFRGAAPQRTAPTMYPVTPPDGYATQQLRNRRPGDDARKIVRPVLQDILERSGYWHTETAVDDVMSALE